MLFRQLFDEKSYTYTYLLAMGQGRGAVLIDPVLDKMDLYLKLLAELKLNLLAVLETHLHADHITASGELQKKTGCSIVMGEQTGATCEIHRVKDEALLDFDGIQLKALYTPGHTDDSYCFLMKDRVFTGDTLLIRGTGRTDFQHGSAESQYESLFHKLLLLPEDTFVYPAHDYNGMTRSTIGEEKASNPRLQVKSCAEYVELMQNLNLANPKMMAIAVPANKKCGL